MTMSNGLLATFSIGLRTCMPLQSQVQCKGDNFKKFYSKNKKIPFVAALPNSNCTPEEEIKIKRSDFPEDFIFGVGTSALQVEGAAKEFGKGLSVWDYYIQQYPDRIADHSTIDRAVDHYKRYKEDVQLIKDLGVEYYRFSIPWTRILPKGSLSGGVNQEGIDHYNALIDELLANGIKPFVTLLHFDTPLALQEKYGGPLIRSFVDDFKDYSELCFKTFGDRVKHWVTINEPFVVAAMGYDLGVAPPGRSSISNIKCVAGDSSREPYIVTHNLLLAHAAAVKVYREKFQEIQKGEIGMSHVGQYAEPYSKSPEDIAAAKRALDFSLGWFMEPLVYGDYPQSMRDLVKDRLPYFTQKEKKMVKGSFDFIGINYYTSRYYKNVEPNPNAPVHYMSDNLAQERTERDDGNPIGPLFEGIYLYPKGLEKLLNFMNETYSCPKIYITENGIAEAKGDDIPLYRALFDPHRITNIRRHLQKIHNAIQNGVNVKGYMYWALFDDFEFSDGYNLRFGLYYIDYKDNLRRIPKHSAKCYRSFLKQAPYS